MRLLRIVVIDAQGGGIGRIVIEQLRQLVPGTEIAAVGTNAVATANMLKGGASAGATGENAVVWNASRCDIIIGPIGVFFANAMLGEITPAMAIALADSSAKKIALPVSKCNIHVMGTAEKPLVQYVEEAVQLAASWCAE